MKKVEYEYQCRMLLLASAVAKVVGHSAENVPPTLSGNDNFVRYEKEEKEEY